MTVRLGRRGILRGVAAAAGAAVGARLPFLPTAAAAPAEKSAVVIIHFVGGYNAFFSSADSFAGNGAFRVSGETLAPLGGVNNLVVDKPTIGQLPQFALQHMATIGNNHGSSDHAQAILRMWSPGTRNYSLMLANALGGSAPIKCAQIAGPGVDIPSPAEGGVSVQGVSDMGSLIETLVGGDARSPDRVIAAKAMAASQKMGKRIVGGSPRPGAGLNDGYNAAVDALNKTPPPFDYRSLPGTYGLQGTAIVNGFASKLCAAELLVRAGTNVVNIFSENDWDTHNSDGNTERFLMGAQVIPHLQRFLSRVHDPAGLGATHNIVTVLMGDFARSLPRDDHQPNISPTVIGKYVKLGTTGRVSANVGLPGNAPRSDGMWAYIAAAAKCPSAPFGANPHPLVL